MVSPKVQHFPTPAVRRVAHAPIVAKRLRESSPPPALRGPSRDSPLRRLRWTSRALELRSRGFAAIRSFPPAFTPFRGHSITCGAACRARSYRRETSAGKQPPAHAWGFIKGFPPAAPAVGESRTGAALQVFPGGMSPASRVIFFREVFYHNPSLVQVYCEQIKYNTITFLKIP